jgi:multidrug efflux pump subunit AcrA (membrane-fusion protein)
MLAASGCSLLPKEEEPLQPPLVKPVKENFDVAEVKKGSIVKQLTGIATFVSASTQQLSFKESGGRLLSIDVKLGDTIKPGDVVAHLDPGDLETRIRLQQLNVEKANIALEDAKANAQAGDTNALKLKLIDVEAAKIQLNQLQQQLDKTRLVSDIGGIVTYVDGLQEGDQVTAYKAVVTVADPKQLQLVYEASNPTDLSPIQVGMEVQLKYKGGEYKGKVLQTPSSAPFTDDKQLAELNGKRIYIGAAGLPEEASIGASADIAVTTERRDDTLIIPRSALRSYIGREYVQVLEGESRKEIDVEKGIVTSTEVEIRKGLKEGQKVILNN